MTLLNYKKRLAKQPFKKIYWNKQIPNYNKLLKINFEGLLSIHANNSISLQNYNLVI